MHNSNKDTVVFIANREVRLTDKGYRLWETTTEGSPVSPFFQTVDELCTWAETNCRWPCVISR